MDNYEVLREAKVCYEYINDILQNSYVSNKDMQKLSKALESLSDIYSKTYNEMLRKEEWQNQLETDLECPHCNNKVAISDLIDYAYLCNSCDENMYLGEGDLNYEWYFNDNHTKLDKSFIININYDSNRKDVYITTENSSGANYKCDNLDGLVNNIKLYLANYVLYDEFYIKIWETEDDRDYGESFNYLETFYDSNSAIREAKKILAREDYAYIEVIREKDDEVIYGSDGIKEEFYFDKERSCEEDELLPY